MTRSERELIIQRYLNGEMTSTQEQDFFIQVAVDKELRQELKAFRTVDSALRKDREAERSEHTALRSRVASMLVVTPGSNQPAPIASPTAAPDMISSTATGLGKAAMKWGIAAGAAAILAVGAFLTLQQPDAPTSPAPAATGAAGYSVRPAPAEIPDRDADAAQTPVQARPDGGAELPRQDVPAAQNSAGAADRPQREPRAGARTPDEPTASQTASTREGSETPSATAEPARSEPRVSDTINIGVRVQFPKK